MLSRNYRGWILLFLLIFVSYNCILCDDLFVERRLWEGCADDLTFNYHLILRTARLSAVRIAFVPISWREEDQVSNAKLFSHGLTMLGIVWNFLIRRGHFTRVDHSTAPTPRTWTALS